MSCWRTTASCRNLPTTRCARLLGPLWAARSIAQYGGAAFPAVWWWDAEKAAKTGGLAGSITLGDPVADLGRANSTAVEGGVSSPAAA